MKLSELIKGLVFETSRFAEHDVKGIVYNSKDVRPGYIFVALPGVHHDGNEFAGEAVKFGACAIVTQTSRLSADAVVLHVKDSRLAMAAISRRFYGSPDTALLLIGLTGTNGKTTTSYFIESIFNTAGISAGVIGTVNYRYGGSLTPAVNTTPESADLYRILRQMVNAEMKAAVVEVSSHALALGRVSGMEFDMAIFTNLTRDHLDFHETMEKYFETKSLLFTGLSSQDSKKTPKFAIINIDDTWGKKLADSIPGPEIVTYGIESKASVTAKNIRSSSKNTEFILVAPSGHKKVNLPHLGRHNIYNALAAASAALSAGIPLQNIVSALEKAPMVPGRLEKIELGQQFTVVVDFAHTDDALLNVLTALKELNPARIITVFGCGGDRDRSKRPLMGEVATALSDFVFVTSDNPRSEDPERIALDIEVGIRRQHRNNYKVIIDREQAIASALTMAQKGDIVLLAGKGHEAYQIIGDKKIHFNDKEIASKYLQLNGKHNSA